MPITVDGRIKFKQTVQLSGPTASVNVAVFGGAIIALQVAVFDAQDEILDGVGFEGFGEVITSEKTGSADWLFHPPKGAAYIKWGVVAIRSAAGLGRYSVTGKLRDLAGDTLASGRFAGEIPDGVLNDVVVYDGVLLGSVKPAAMAKGPQA